MSWNDTFYYFAVLTLALALAQFGISHVSTSTFTGIFKRKPNEWVREVIRVMPKFLAIVSILALGLAIFAGLELIFGFATNLSILIAHQLNYLNNTTLLHVTEILFCLLIGSVVFFILRILWRVAARLPDNKQDTQQDIGDINREIRLHLKDIRERNVMVKREKHGKRGNGI